MAKNDYYTQKDGFYLILSSALFMFLTALNFGPSILQFVVDSFENSKYLFLNVYQEYSKHVFFPL
jgi:hypothetical protein